MQAVYLYGLKHELKSIKTIIISIVFIGLSFLIAKYSGSLSIILDSNGSSPAIQLMFLCYAFMGFLFSSILFGGIISKEVETETLRYITPYLSRRKIYTAKYLITITYFLLVILLALIVVFSVRGVIVVPWRDLLSIIVFFLYIESVIIMVSTISKNERTATLVGIVLSLLFPAIFTVAYFRDNIFLDAIDWLLPYRYLEGTNSWELLILLLLACAAFYVGMVIFERKEI